MGSHNARSTVSERFLKRIQFHAFQMLPVRIYDRQFFMAVLVGIPVSWKMLDARQHSRALKSVYVSRGFFRHILRVAAERTHTDYGVRRIGVHIGRRSEIVIHSHPRTSFTHTSPHTPYKPFVLHRAKSERPRIVECRVEPHGQPALESHSREKLRFGHTLRPVYKSGSFRRFIPVHRYSAYVALFNKIQRPVPLGLRVYEYGRDEHLPYLFF